MGMLARIRGNEAAKTMKIGHPRKLDPTKISCYTVLWPSGHTKCLRMICKFEDCGSDDIAILLALL
jgi:D-tyrosyl-tRNA(Tyr) deacylase